MASWFLVHRNGLVIRREGERIALPTEADAASLGLSVAGAHEFGEGTGGRDRGLEAPESVPEPFDVIGLRELYGILGEDAFLQAGRATQIVEWARTHQFCGRCKTPTEPVAGERCLRCPSCELLAYPRISPAIIVLVRRGHEALLARGARFPARFYSALAGFVEVGESLEEALVREVREEVGLEVDHVRYFGSQPWPFPHSLMVGFFAEWSRGELRPDGVEILEASWFRADALPPIPPPISIARRLIDAWVAEAGSVGR